MDDVYAWAIQSPYSPLNLQYLSQPTPQGMHPSWEGRFTFRDAFEDLLVAGSGSPLPSLDEHARKKMMESNLFTTNWGLGAGLGLHVAHWVAEIGVSGLWGSYFDLRPELRNCFDWRPSRRMDMSGLNRRLYFRTRLENGGLFDEWSGQEREVVDRGRDWAEIWHEAMKVVRDVTKYVDGDDNGDADADADADAEEDLYTSRFSTGSHSHSTPKDMRVAERPDTDTNTSVSANTALQKQQHQQYVPEGLEPEQVTTTEYADGSKRVTKTKRKERDGKTEITTTSEHFDADGKLLADTKETTTTRTWSGRLPGAEASFSWTFNKDAKTHTKARGEWNNASDANGEDGHGEDDSQPGRRKDENSGWFWKR
jgi:hypothetical protein